MNERPAVNEEPGGDRAIEGGCLCGAIRYRISGPTTAAVHCHCSMCRRSTGAVVATWITVAATDFHLLRGTPKVYVSSPKGERRFCDRCGAQLIWASPLGTDTLDVTVGTLDHPEHHAADRHIFIDDRVPWLKLDEGLDAYPGEGPPPSGGPGPGGSLGG
ncbi:MAG: GFA family protein [Rhodospirillales bacterium]